MTPSDVHQAAVKKLVDRYGFIDWGFMWFFKSCIGIKFADIGLSYDDLFSIARDSGPKNHQRMTAITKQISSMRPKVWVDILFDDDDGYSEGFGAFCKHLGGRVVVLPDTWRFRNNRVEVVEVGDSSPLSFNRLSRYSMIEDALFHTCRIRFSLDEYCCKHRETMAHDTCRVFDQTWDVPTDKALKEAKGNTQKMRWYHENRDRKLMPISNWSEALSEGY